MSRRPIPARAGPRGWYQCQNCRPFFWTGKLHPEKPQGLIRKLQIQRFGKNGEERKFIATFEYIHAPLLRAMTAGERIVVPAEIDGLPTAEAVKAAEDAR